MSAALEVAAFAVLAVVLLGSVCVLAWGAALWAKALSAVVNADLHMKQLRAMEDEARAGGKLLAAEPAQEPRTLSRPPRMARYDEDDLEDAIVGQRQRRGADQGFVETTDENSGYDEEEPPVPGEPTLRV